MTEIKSPDCPLCGHPPKMAMSGGMQAFCGNDDCDGFCWNPSMTLAENRASSTEVRIDGGTWTHQPGGLDGSELDGDDAAP